MAADANCEEAALWAQIADAQVKEIAIQNMYLDEQTQRTAILTEQGAAAANLWNIAALQANSLMFALHKRCDEAAQETLSWQQVSDSLARECEEQRHRSKAHETMLQDEMKLKQQMMQQELESKMNVEGVHVALQDDVKDLQARKLSLERNVAELQQETSALQTSLQAHKISSLDEKQQLEQQLQALRHQINVERANLQEVKEANAAVAAAPSGPAAPVESSSFTSKSASPPHAGEGDSLHQSRSIAEPQSADVSYKTTPSRSGGTLASGLAALQNVREQLREMRETSVSASPPRAHSAAILGAEENTYSSPYPSQELRQANSYAYMPTSPDGGRVGVDGQTVASPWKARLLKLQGELKSLRTELGTSSPEN